MKYLSILFIFALVGVVHGQANLTFSGGSGTPLTTTLQNSVIYTLTDSSCANNGPVFIFKGVGNPLEASRTVSGTINFSVNRGTSRPVSTEGSGFAGGAIEMNDIYLFGSAIGANGNTVVLSTGTITTLLNQAVAKPRDGTFTTYITTTGGLRCSTDGVAIEAPPPAFCSYSAAVSNQPFSPIGGNGTIDVTASNGCPVNAYTNDAFIVVNSDGSNGGVVTFTVNRNYGDVRHGRIYIGNLIITIDQFAGTQKSRTQVKF